MPKKIFLLVAFLLFRFNLVNAQDNVGIKVFGLSIHPKGDENAFLMPRKLDDQGVLVLNLGAVVSYEKFLIKDQLSIKTAQAFYSDCADRLGGFSHIGFRAKIFNSKKHALYGGMGPTLVYRRNWLELEGYRNPDFFKGGEADKWQCKFLWYGGEFEYVYKLNQKIQLASSFIPGYPKLMSLSFGLRYLTAAKP
ncbi:MAG TPA: hypothetical protein VEV16_13090 [Daejeonella sp.]|nr:hypothetical protein [Daejeonella sp.]